MQSYITLASDLTAGKPMKKGSKTGVPESMEPDRPGLRVEGTGTLG